MLRRTENQDEPWQRPSTSSGRKHRQKPKAPKKQPPAPERSTTQYADKLNGLMSTERDQLAQQVLIAAEKGNKKAMYLLLHQGVSPQHCLGMQGYTPLHHAATRGHLAIAELLVQFGWPLNQTNKFGEAALHLACHGGHFHIAEFLLDKGADVNVVTSDHETALFYAARKGHFRIVRLLLRRDVDWRIRNRFDDIAEDEATEERTRHEFDSSKEDADRLGREPTRRPRGPESTLQTKHREHIFSYLPLPDLSRALQVCYRWQRAADAPRLWARFKVSRWELSLNKSLGLGLVAPMSGYRPKQATTRKGRPSTSGADLFLHALGLPSVAMSCSKAESQRRPQTAIVAPRLLLSPRDFYPR
ncbi:hypothetical protein SDRG_10301 [Saprolegnia diclina VS20]|uniref:F-box domain-containing protein n=1 Tax=Saprolegnia diclina (strain VS20) TaxID=1156394 RepID=T0QEU3_SAPDV|nr:hypothetical protein SDRG_10301 [Saprolegnia diclina VS20]EQC32105.1 hypothetical protein SDRG_10301 [Saprolegnia diclina VS20]|eukprot:XP_008614507.1 hypothetical protein SDRG_10301 [Saprolegnia diclina VS20]